LPTVPGYEMLRELGRGGMGVVYLAREIALDRTVALKMILRGDYASATERQRFRVEAEAVARLQHPNIVQIHAIGEHDGLPYVALEYCAGGSLKHHLGGQPLKPAQAAKLVETLAQAMATAHQKQIIHRDLKPHNVLLTETGEPKIGDFGLAKKLDNAPLAAALTATGHVIGTPSYMAPEQARGERVGPLADVYALGAMLYELLTGRPPCLASTVMETLSQVLHVEPVAPRQLQPGVPRALETICLKCLHKEPQRRYASASALAEDLERFRLGKAILAHPAWPGERAWRWIRRHPVVAGLATLVFLTMALGTVTAAYFAFEANLQASAFAEQKQTAEEERQAAVLALQEAQQQERIAKSKERQAVAARQRLERSKDAATNQHKVAEAAFHRLTREVQAKLKNTEGTPEQIRESRKQIMVAAAEELEKLAKVARANVPLADNSPLAGRGLAQSLLQIARMYQHDLNEPTKAADYYQQFYAVVEGLARDEPNSDLARGNLSLAHIVMGDLCLDMAQGGRQARDKYLEALLIRQQLLDHPRDTPYSRDTARRLLVDVQRKLAQVSSRLGDPAQAKQYYLAILAAYDEEAKTTKNADDLLQRKTGVYQALADVCWRLGDDKGVAECEERCLPVRRMFVQKSGNNPASRQDLALALGAFGDARLRLGQLDKAKEHYKEHFNLLNGLVMQDNNPHYRRLLARAHHRLGILALLQHKPADATKSFKQMKSQLASAKVDPKTHPARGLVMMALARCGDHVAATAIADDLRKYHRLQPEMLFQVACGYAVCAETAGAAHAKFEPYVELALECLKLATAGDFKDPVAVETDPDLAVLRDREDYGEMLAQIKKRAGRS
jgi:tetratricopeptide (TPR) repeat protein